MRTLVLAFSALICVGAGALVARTIVATSIGGNAYIFAPKLVDSRTPPSSALIAGEVFATDKSAQLITLQISDPYAPTTTLLVQVRYDEKTQFGASSYAAGIKRTAADVQVGSRVLAVVRRSAGTLYLNGLSESKQYD